jgi:RHS repeat-associated protein
VGESGETWVCPFRWQTRWYDPESQHYYFLHRYYDPRLGRWLSRDPIGEEGGLNLYAYCGNDPVNRHDPLGLADYRSGYQYQTTPTIWDVLIPATSAGLRGGRSPWGSQNDAVWHSTHVTQPLLKTVGVTGSAIAAAPMAAPFVVEAPALAAAGSEGTAFAYGSAQRAAAWWLSGGEATVATWGTRAALVLGGSVATYDAFEGAPAGDALKDGAGTFLNITSFTGIGNPNFRLPTLPSFNPRWNPVNWRPVYAGLTTGGLPTGWRYVGPGKPSPQLSPILLQQKDLSILVNRQGAVVDRWLASSNNEWARLYRARLTSDPNFARGIRGRFLDVRMREFFRERFARTQGIQIDRTVSGETSDLRPDLYFENLGGRSVIFDVGSPSKIDGILKYEGMADELIPLIPEQWFP